MLAHEGFSQQSTLRYYSAGLILLEDEIVNCAHAKIVAAIENSFNYEVGGIGRYSGDTYYGGNPWILSTLWLALYYEKLKDIERMEELIAWVIEHATELGLLSEQVNKSNGSPISAVPLAWSHAFLILAVLDLDKMKDTKE